MTVTPHPERRRRNPRIPVVLYAHPFELALGAALVINGVRGALGGLSPSVDQLPDLPLALYLIVSTVGGLGVLAGLITHRKTIERSALYLVAASYAAFAILVLTTNCTAGIATGIVAAVVAAACVLRAKAIRKAAQIVLNTLVTSREDAE